MKEEINKKIKKNAWTFEIYKDSCNPKWEEILINSHIQFVYAYHDKDENPDGTVKKPHTHVMIYFDGPTTYNNALELAKRVGAANEYIQPVGSVRGMVRYFTHKDNADKYQYNDTIIQCRNGFDIDNFIDLTLTQKKEIKKAITIIIKEKGITEYADLMNYLLDENLDDLWDIASNNTLFFKSYIDSQRYKLKEKEIEIERKYANIIE